MFTENSTIVIPHVIDWDMTKRCVDSCIKNGRSKTIYILDNSKDGIVHFDYPDEMVIYVYRIYDEENDCPKPCSIAWNIGMLVASIEYLIVLNSDTEVPKDFDYIMRQEIDKYQDCVCVSVPEIHPDNWKDVEDISKLDCGKFVEGLNGPCFMLKRSFWERIGKFDDRFIPSCYEDVDFYKRIVEDGKKAIVTGKTCIMHHGAYTRNNEEMLKLDSKQNGCYHIQANKKRFCEKWQLQEFEADKWEQKMKNWHSMQYEQFYGSI